MKKTVLIFAAAVSLSSASLFADDFHREFHTSATPHVSIRTGSGYIHFNTGDGNEVRIVGHVRSSGGWSMSRTISVADATHQAEAKLEQSGDNVSAGRDLNLRNITIDYDVTLPRRSSIEGHTGSGDVRAANVEGTLAADSGSGDIEIANAHNGVRLETGSGSIRARSIAGAAMLRTGSGDVELDQSAAGDVMAESGSGSLRLRNVNGSLRARTGSGDVEASGMVGGDWRISTGSGSARLSLGNGARFHIDADTGSGTVRVAQIPSNDSHDRHHFSGSANGGGPTIHVSTGSGDVEVR